MSDKQIKIKLTLNAIREYVGGAEALLNDIKNAGLTLHKAESGFSMTCNVSGKFSAYTYAYENLSQIKALMVYDLSNNEIAKLKIEFLELDDNIYDMPDDAYIDGNEIFISFVEIITHTITFTNTEHPEFEVEFPESITVIDGESIELPSTSGSFEDENYIYTPSTWSIGEFGESVTPTEDITTNLLWNASKKKPDFLEGVIGEPLTFPEGLIVNRLESQWLYFTRGGYNSENQYYYVFWKYQDSGYNWNNFWKYLPSYDLIASLPYSGTWYVHSFSSNTWVEIDASTLGLSMTITGDPSVFVYPCNRPNGLVIYKNGEWWTMGSETYTISNNRITFPSNTNENPSYGKPFRVYFE